MGLINNSWNLQTLKNSHRFGDSYINIRLYNNAASNQTNHLLSMLIKTIKTFLIFSTESTFYALKLIGLLIFHLKFIKNTLVIFLNFPFRWDRSFYWKAKHIIFFFKNPESFLFNISFITSINGSKLLIRTIYFLLARC